MVTAPPVAEPKPAVILTSPPTLVAPTESSTDAPAAMVIAPPVALVSVVLPAVRVMAPPAPVLPSPTVRVMSPPLPPVAAP